MRLYVFTLLAGVMPLLAGNFELPPYETYTLKNGMTIYLMEQHEVPLVHASAVFQAGSVFDGQNHGAASVTAEALMLGTQKRDKVALQDFLDFHGANMRTAAEAEQAALGLSFAADDVEAMVALLAEMLQQPAFPSQEFDKLIQRRIGMAKRMKESPGNVIHDYYHKFMYGDHPYGNPASGSANSLEKLTLEDVKTYFGTYFVPQRMAFIMVGDFETKAMKKLIKAHFGRWKAKPVAEPLPEPDAFDGFSTKARVLLVDKPDSRQTTFYIGAPGIPRNHPDEIGLMVVNTVLGGRFTSWLNNALRIESGLSYGARSRFSAQNRAGVFYASSFTKTDTTFEAVDLTIKVLKRLVNEGLDQETLDSAKAYVKGQFPPRYETTSELAGFLGDAFIYGLDESFINKFQDRVEALDLEKAQALAQQYFPADNFQILLIGQGDAIRSKASQYGQLLEKSIQDPGF